MRLRTLLPALLLLAAAPAAAGAQTTIGQLAPADYAGPIGRDDLSVDPTTRVIAQTFVAPVGSPFLQSFTFLLADYVNGADLRLRGAVYAFDGDRLSGPALYESDLLPGSTAFDLEPMTFGGTLNLALAPATTYALVLSSIEGTPDFALNFFGATAADTYAGGELLASTETTTPALFVPGAFAPIPGSPDAAFQATFTASAVPEPATVVLVGGGLLALAGVARRRR